MLRRRGRPPAYIYYLQTMQLSYVYISFCILYIILLATSYVILLAMYILASVYEIFKIYKRNILCIRTHPIHTKKRLRLLCITHPIHTKRNTIYTASYVHKSFCVFIQGMQDISFQDYVALYIADDLPKASPNIKYYGRLPARIIMNIIIIIMIIMMILIMIMIGIMINI